MGVTSSVGIVSPPSLPSLSLTIPTPRSYFSSFARSTILQLLTDAILVGSLSIGDSYGTYSFGELSSTFDLKKSTSDAYCPPVHLRVVNDAFWTRVLMSGDLGFSEAYMIGDVQVSDLKACLELFTLNHATLLSLTSSLLPLGMSTLSPFLSSLSIRLTGQTKSQARLNAVASYDQSNALFRAFLSREMMYSCALWGDEEGGPRGDLEFDEKVGKGMKIKVPTPDLGLENAQLRKIHYVLKKARCHLLKPGSRLLEFGTGWGGLAIQAASTYPIRVTTLTLSTEQKALAEARIRAAGLQDRIDVHLMDYREMPAEWEGVFDAFVSVEMVEHVGTKHYDTYFGLIDWALKKGDAAAVVTGSTFPESRYSGYQPEDFMRRYMWPNSALPSATALITSCQRASAGRFTLECVENHAAHYPRTLREWGRRLERSLPSPPPVVVLESTASSSNASTESTTMTVPATPTAESLDPTLSDPSSASLYASLLRSHPSLKNRNEFESFKRKWQYLYAYAGAGFAKGWITCHMLVWVRENDVPAIACA